MMNWIQSSQLIKNELEPAWKLCLKGNLFFSIIQ